MREEKAEEETRSVQDLSETHNSMVDNSILVIATIKIATKLTNTTRILSLVEKLPRKVHLLIRTLDDCIWGRTYIAVNQY